ncbi:MAG: (d)CMP kinase [Bacteroidota bacterium]
MRKIIIAIDGYSACGKSTTAKEVARILGYSYIDSGAMYRAVTHCFMEHHVALTNPREVTRALDEIKISFQTNSKGISETFLNGLNVEKKIRKMKVSENVSQVSAIKDVRTAMVDQQRRLGKAKGIVMDGRDIGTVVFPEAELKLFLTADMQTRAFRRQQELLEKGEMIELDEIIANIKKRDEIDSTRMDTTHVTIDEQVDEVIRLAIGHLIKPLKSPATKR